MNIFVLDEDPRIAAQYHCDKHVVKMILETAQILSTVVQSRLNKAVDGLYKVTHKNHPCTIWTSRSRANFDWLCALGRSLCLEYHYRYKKNHKSVYPILLAQSFHSKIDWEFETQTSFVQCMPDHLRSEDPIESYRRYYIEEKSHFAKWTIREKPDWFIL